MDALRCFERESVEQCHTRNEVTAIAVIMLILFVSAPALHSHLHDLLGAGGERSRTRKQSKVPDEITFCIGNYTRH